MKTVLTERTVVPKENTTGARPRATPNLQELFKATPISPEKKTVEQPTLAQLPVEIAALKAAWQDFADQRKDQVAEYQLLTRDFSYKGSVITVSLANPVEETLLENFKRDLLQYLRDRLQNTELTILPVHQVAAAQKMAYTSREKFEKMAEKNPKLIELKDRLGLDWEF